MFLFWKGFKKHFPWVVVLLWVEGNSLFINIRLEGCYGPQHCNHPMLEHLEYFLFFRGGVLVVLR